MARTRKVWTSPVAGLCLLALAATAVQAATPDGPTPEWKIRFAWVGQTLRTAGFQPQQADLRYDFQFTQVYKSRSWQFTMSAVLSQDGETLWLVAWLNELPEDAQPSAEALLQVLTLNDRLGGNTFFAYLPTYRRLVLERPVGLQGRRLDGKALREVILDLSRTVADTYSTWSSLGVSRLAANRLGSEPTGQSLTPSSSSSVQPAARHAPARIRLLPEPAAAPKRDTHRPLIKLQWFPVDDR